MGQLLQGIPKMLLGAIMVVATLLFMYFSEPPITICDIQLETVQEKLNKDFLMRSDEKFGKMDSPIGRAYEYCFQGNSPGACYDVFRRYIIFERQLRTLPAECGSHPKVVAFQSWVSRMIVLMAKIAWGEKPPDTLYDKRGWLQDDQVALFCRLKREYHRLYGKAAWTKLRDGTLISLPESQTLTRKGRWEKSIFSIPCLGYI